MHGDLGIDLLRERIDRAEQAAFTIVVEFNGVITRSDSRRK